MSNHETTTPRTIEENHIIDYFRYCMQWEEWRGIVCDFVDAPGGMLYPGSCSDEEVIDKLRTSIRKYQDRRDGVEEPMR